MEVGGTLEGTDGTEIIATEIIHDAWELLQEGKQSVSLPAEGKRYYLITLSVANVQANDDSLYVGASDFELVGDSRVVYSFDFGNHCGGYARYGSSAEGVLSGEIYPGGRLEGRICFEVPETEGNLVLIHKPDGSKSLRFLSLE